MNIKQILVFFLLGLLSACSSSNKIYVREPEQFQGTAVMYYPMIAKIAIKKEKVNHIYINSNCSIETSCEMLAYNDALEKFKIDGIFEPIYYHKVDYDKTTITVTGYPYTFTEFREVTKEDRDLLASPGSTWIPVQTNNRPYNVNDAKADAKTPWGTILGVTGGIVGVLLLSALVISD
jgi:hypothetical protein